MELGLKGKVVLVTGGTRGIGRAIAECFAAEGVRISLCARNDAELAGAVDALNARGVEAWGLATDMREEAGVNALVEGTVAAFGQLDVVVSNVSALTLTDDAAAWAAAFDTDMLGTVRLFAAARSHLLAAAERSGDAAFTLISSIVAGEPYRPSPYSVMKAGLINYAKGIARTHAAQKLRCNVVSPGNVYFEGGVWQRMEQERPEFYADWIAQNPTGRMATAEEVAATTVFVSSPRASFTTGTNAIVDGCLTHHAAF